MTLYAILATEGYYEGQHGVEDLELFETNEEGDAQARATQLSLELMESFHGVMEALEEEAEDLDCDLWEVMLENVQYEIFKVDPKWEEKYSEQELEEMFCNDPDEFISTYCLEE